MMHQEDEFPFEALKKFKITFAAIEVKEQSPAVKWTQN
jgi:hypothetical protein